MNYSQQHETEIANIHTTRQLRQYYKGLGHAVLYGNYYAATRYFWNNETQTKTYVAAIYAKTGRTVKLVFALDNEYEDNGHALFAALAAINDAENN